MYLAASFHSLQTKFNMKLNFETNQLVELDFLPEKKFIVTPIETISWQQAKYLSDKIIAIFSFYKIPKGHPIIIYGHKEALYPVSIMACILAEMPYVPIDVIFPIERMTYIKNFTESSIVINCTNNECPFENLIEINEILEHKIIGNIPSNFVSYYDAKDPLVYIMFTSGSTGAPKGVEITRKNIICFRDWITNDEFNFSSETVFMNHAVFTFDVSLNDLIPCIALGATSVCVPKELYDKQDTLFDYLKTNKVNVWTSTPAFLYYNLFDENFNSINLPSLNCFMIMGERFTSAIGKKSLERFANAEIINAYGPTEATIITSKVVITHQLLEKYIDVPIGVAKPNAELAIIDDNNIELEMGSSGEILICGNHVAKGYFKSNELTVEKFIDFKKWKAYKTGDIGYYKDGLLFISGRKDEQIKFNGYRIELNEISNCINLFDKVKHSETIALRRNGEVKKIVAFVQLKTKDSDVDLDGIIEHCKTKLPHYMIPADFRFIDEFPYNTNLKVDKKKLEDIYLKK